MNKTQDEIKSLHESSLHDELEKHKLVDNEKLVISEILKAAKCKNARGRRYSEDWLLLCIIFHMRSPASYRLIRDTKVLPLPAISTVRR